MESKPDLEYLAHYGVKGMKWGVRKDRRTGESRIGRKLQSIEKKSTAKYQSLSSEGWKSSYMEEEYGVEPSNDLLSIIYYGKTKKRLLDKQKENALRASYMTKQALGQSLTSEEKALFQSDGKKFGAVVGTAATMALGITAVRMLGANRAKKVMKLVAKGANVSDKGSDLLRVGGNVNKFLFDLGYMKRGSDIFDAIPKRTLKAMDDAVVRIPAGSTLKRMSMDKETGAVMSRIYASFDPEDVMRYKGYLPAAFKRRMTELQTDDVYEVSYKAQKELVSPSQKERFRLFVDEIADLRSSNPDAFADAISTWRMEKARVLKKSPSFQQIEKMSNEDIARHFYDNLAMSLIDPENNAVAAKYIERVRKAGYNMIIDDNDFQRLAKSPVIILDTAEAVTHAGARKLETAEIDAARALMKGFRKRNGR